MDNFRVVILMGPPASGKGTQADLLEKNYNFYHLEVGRMIKRKFEELKDDPEIERLKKEFSEGQITSPSRVAQWLIEEVKNLKSSKADLSGIVFDGSLRTLEETKVVFPFLEKKFGKENILAIYINIKPETTIFRSIHRKICENCGKPLIFTRETADIEKCASCGGKLVKRGLDKPEIIKKRLEVYEEQTKPVFTYLKTLGILREVDGEGTVEDIFSQIQLILDGS